MKLENKMTQEELTKILELHKKWVNSEDGGIRADLRDADLRGANLRGADFEGADLRGANFEGADLVEANLKDAYLRCADFEGADLKRANFIDVNLRGADFEGADLREADLRGADLKRADFEGADLRGADLRDTDLRDAYLEGANFEGADLRDCIGNNREIKSLLIGKYFISYNKHILNIGCKSYTLEQWKSFTDKEIEEMDRGNDSLEWWKLNRDIIIPLVEREMKQ